MKTTTQLLIEPCSKYKQFLDICKDKTYPEDCVLHKHHIIPKCLGGTNAKNNLIVLSVEDHIAAHLILSKCFDDGSAEQISNLRSARILNKKSIKDQETLKRIANTF